MPAAPQPAMAQVPYGGYPGAAPGGYAPAVPAGYRAPGGDMTARSLIDDRALPGWMNQAPGGAPPAGVGGTFGPREGLDARSLVDESSLPQWLQGLQGGAAAAPAPQWSPGPVAQEPASAWLGQPAGMGTGGVGAPGVAPISPPMPAGGPHSMNAGQLADESALPPWLRAQGPGAQGPGASASSAAGPNAVPGLVDPNALPSWVRSGSAAAETRFNGSMAGAPAGQAPRRPPNSEWLTDAHVPARQGPPPSGVPGGGELPSWLRNGSPAADPPASSVANRGFGQPAGVPEDQLPPWLQRGQGQPAGSSAAQRPLAGPPPRNQPDFSGSRAGYVDPRLQQQQGGYGQGGYGGQNQWGQGDPGDGYQGEEYADWDDEGQQRRRGGFFGRFRRK
jgi:hypothetical protein